MEVCDVDEGRRRWWRLLLLLLPERGRRLWGEDGARFCCHVAADDAAADDAAADDAAVGGPVTGRKRAIWCGPGCFGSSSGPRALHFDGGRCRPLFGRLWRERLQERVVMGRAVLSYSLPHGSCRKIWEGGGGGSCSCPGPDRGEEGWQLQMFFNAWLESSRAQHSTAHYGTARVT